MCTNLNCTGLGVNKECTYSFELYRPGSRGCWPPFSVIFDLFLNCFREFMDCPGFKLDFPVPQLPQPREGQFIIIYNQHNEQT